MNFNFDVGIRNNEITVGNERYNIDHDDSACRNLNRIASDYLSRLFYEAHGLYSKQIYFPDTVQFAVEWTLAKRYEIKSTQHMAEKAEMLNIPVGAYKAALYGEVIEAELEHGTVVKVVTRLPHRFDSTLDICFAVAIEDNGEAHVKTMWLNRKGDKHWTICKENYVREEN